jgi:hypothetical protein
VQVGKSSANRASNAINKKAATAAAEEGSAALSAVFAKGAKSLEDLRKVQNPRRMWRFAGTYGQSGYTLCYRCLYLVITPVLSGVGGTVQQ